jgi:hypothetical protein
VTAPTLPTVPELATWRRIRRYAVPASMIAEATRARLAGDWVGACAAARFDVDVDLATVAREYGRAVADRLAEDLAHFAPDLLRWHLPRHLGGRTSLSPRVHAVLTPSTAPDGVLLHVVTPTIVTGSQRLRLRVAHREALAALRFYDAPPYIWDVRRAGELRHAWGGSDDRPPLLNPDATPVPEVRLGVGDDRAARSERVLLQLAAGAIAEAWRTAGIELDLTAPESPPWAQRSALDVLALPSAWPVGLADEVRRLAGRYGLDEVILSPGWPAQVRLRPGPDGGVQAELTETTWTGSGRPYLAEPTWHRPADLDLVARGLLRPDELHPLVRAALFPRLAEPAARPEPQPAPPESVRVRCRGAWHVVHVDGGRLRLEAHDRDEEERERTLRALGGSSTGCFGALHAWQTGSQRLPKALRQHRADLLERIFQGDTAMVVEMLDSGRLDPWMRDGRGWTLLHMLLYLDHRPLLPRLLAAGLPIDVRENTGRTPLHVAVGNDGSPALARALFEAGADPTAADEWDGGIQELLDHKENTELDFLRVESKR